MKFITSLRVVKGRQSHHVVVVEFVYRINIAAMVMKLKYL